MTGNVAQFRTLIDALDAAPGSRPFVTFWVDEDEFETVTFGEFRRRSRLQANVLREGGASVGDPVVIIMPQGIEAMTMFVGAMLLGAVPAFLAYPNFKVDATKYRSGLAGVTANLKAKIVVIDRDFPDDLLGHVSLSGGAVVLRDTDGREQTEEQELPALQINPGNVAFIQHSAGTTGLQKGVALTHRAVLRQLEHLSQALAIDGTTDRIYSWLPLYHDMGLIACFMLPLVCHVPIVMQSPLDWVMHPESMLQVLTDFKCTLAWLPNFAFQFVPRRVPRNRWPQYDLSSVRALINCSEPVRQTSMSEFETAFSSIGLRRDAMHSSYAMAENVFAVTQSDIHRVSGPTCLWADGPEFRGSHRIVPIDRGTQGSVCFASSGKLLPDHEIRIVSASGTMLAPDGVGEILIKSDCLFDGYYNRPDLTANVFVDGWYHTGDLGFIIQQELYVIGRKKDLLIVGGENIYPQDIEELVAGHPAIHDGRVIALGIYNPDLGTEDLIVVAEVEREESLADTAEIEKELRGRIVAGLGIAVRTILLKPPHWIVKSTAGKAARSTTREKLILEHPELDRQFQETP